MFVSESFIKYVSVCQLVITLVMSSKDCSNYKYCFKISLMSGSVLDWLNWNAENGVHENVMNSTLYRRVKSVLSIFMVTCTTNANYVSIRHQLCCCWSVLELEKVTPGTHNFGVKVWKRKGGGLIRGRAWNTESDTQLILLFLKKSGAKKLPTRTYLTVNLF